MKQQIPNDVVAVRLICRPSTIKINEPFQIIVECRSTEKPFVGQSQLETNSSEGTPLPKVASLCGKLEGMVRTRYAGQQEVRQFLVIPLDFERFLEQRNGSGRDCNMDKRGSNETQLSFRFATGASYRFEEHLRVPEGYPGTLQTKNTYVEYVVSVRLRLNTKGSSTHEDFCETSQIRVQPKFDIKRFVSYQTPIQITKTFNRSVFFLSKSKTIVSIQLEKTAFLQGERIIIRGKVVNENSSRTLKGLIQLIMIARAQGKKNSKEFALTITRSPIVGTNVNSEPINKFENNLKIPADAHPTFCSDTVPLECHYQISISVYDCEPIEIPVLIGTQFGDSDKIMPSSRVNQQPNGRSPMGPYSYKNPLLTYYPEEALAFSCQNPSITFPSHSYQNFQSNYAFFPPKYLSLTPRHPENHPLPGEFPSKSPTVFPTPPRLPMLPHYSFPPIMSSQQVPPRPLKTSPMQRLCFKPFVPYTMAMSSTNFFSAPSRHSNCASENDNNSYIARSVVRIEEIE